MDKNTLIKNLSEKIYSGEISKNEVISLFENSSDKDEKTKKSLLSNALNIIGGLLVLVGVYFFIFQNWDDLGAFGRIIVTFGIGIFALYMGLFLNKKEYSIISKVAYILSAIFLSTGMFVAIEELNIVINNVEAYIFGVLAIIYLVSFLHSKKTLLILITLIFATLCYFTKIYYFFEAEFSNYKYLPNYAVIVWAISCGLIAYFISENKTEYQHEEREKNIYMEVVYFLSTMGVLTSLAKFNSAMDYVSLIVAIGIVILATTIRSSLMLLFSTLFFAYKLSSILVENFSNQAILPFIIIFIGMTVISMGYLNIYLHKKYFKK